MVSLINRITVFVVPLLLMFSCSLKVTYLKDVPIETSKVLDISKRTDYSFIIYPLEDATGPEYAYLHPVSWIPVIHLFYFSNYTNHPEDWMQEIANTGTFGDAFPYFLARACKDMGLTPKDVAISSAMNNRTDIKDYDYAIKGKITKAQLKAETNIIPLAFLSIFGVPSSFYKYDLEIEIIVVRGNDPNKPILQKKYTYENHAEHNGGWGGAGRRVVPRLFFSALKEVLPKIVEDIGTTVSGQK